MMMRLGVSNPSRRPGVKRSMSGMAWLRSGGIPLVDQERGHPLEKIPKRHLDLGWQRALGQRLAHQLHPAVARCLVDAERRMPGAETLVAALFDVALGSAE